MKCDKCGGEMREGYLFSTKDGAFSFANEVPKLTSNAKNTEGFVKITDLQMGKRTRIEASVCDKCRKLVVEF